MTDDAMKEGYKNWGRGPSSGRPDSVGPHDVTKDQNDPTAKGLDPNKDYNGGGAGNGPNKGMGIVDGPKGPVNIQPKK